MKYLKLSTFSDNARESVLHISLRNGSSIEYNNMVNNSAFMKYHGAISLSAKTALNHFVFLNNMHPLIDTSQYGRTILIDRVFDIPKEFIYNDNDEENEENYKNNDQKDFKMFKRNITSTQCVFEKNPTIKKFTNFSSNLCHNKFARYDSGNKNENESGFISTIIWLIILFAFFFVFSYLCFSDPRAQARRKKYENEEREQRIPFINKVNQKYFY